MHSYNVFMTKYLLVIFICIRILAQDEWFFNDMLRGNVTPEPPEIIRQHYFGSPKTIGLDLTGDGRNEFIRFQIIDGRTYVRVYNDMKNLISEQKLEIKGYEAKPYRIIKKYLTKTSIATIIIFFEGKTGYLEKQGSSALYVAVSDDGNLNNFQFKKLTSVWLEHEKLDNYVRRPYEISFEDIDRDGKNEIVVQSGVVKRIFYYDSNNIWRF